MPLVHNSYLHRVIANQQRGLAASTLRAGLRIAEFFYASATALRNKLYDTNILRAHHLPVPVISIGNITAGGTGKTPFVRWLATKLNQNGFHPAILMRGYKRSATGISDEQSLLAEQLKELKITVQGNPNRVAGGRDILQTHPQTDVILLDDGFQHRRLARDVDLVLIDATNPMGFNHLHPRGLLRESPAGLRRATAILFTRCDQVELSQLDQLVNLRVDCPTIPIFRSQFIHSGLRSAATPVSAPPDIPLEKLKTGRIFLTSGIANPTPFEATLQKLTGADLNHLWFPDHHDFTSFDLAEIHKRAKDCNASAIITTEKDWIKIRSLPGAADASVPLWRLDLDMQINADDEPRLWDLLTSRLRWPQQNRPPQPHDPGENQNRHHYPNPRP